MEAMWAPPDNPVFQKTSPTFEIHADHYYQVIGSPTIDIDSFWIVFSKMKDKFEGLDPSVCQILTADFQKSESVFAQDIQLQLCKEPTPDQSFVDERLFSDIEDSDLEDDNIPMIEFSDTEDAEYEVDFSD